MSTPPEPKTMPRSAGLRPGVTVGSVRLVPGQGPALARPVVPSPVRPTTADHPVAPVSLHRMPADRPVFAHPARWMPSDRTVCLTFPHREAKNRTECPTFPGQTPSNSPECPIFPARNRPFRPILPWSPSKMPCSQATCTDSSHVNPSATQHPATRIALLHPS